MTSQEEKKIKSQEKARQGLKWNAEKLEARELVGTIKALSTTELAKLRFLGTRGPKIFNEIIERQRRVIQRRFGRHFSLSTENTSPFPSARPAVRLRVMPDTIAMKLFNGRAARERASVNNSWKFA